MHMPKHIFGIYLKGDLPKRATLTWQRLPKPLLVANRHISWKSMQV